MALSVTHKYTLTVAEDPASGTPGGVVGPNEWNASHSITGGTSGAVLFDNAGTIGGDSGFIYAGSGGAVTLNGASGCAFHAAGPQNYSAQVARMNYHGLTNKYRPVTFWVLTPPNKYTLTGLGTGLPPVFE